MFSALGRYRHGKIIVVIIYRDQNILPIPLPGKRILPVCQQKFLIRSIRKCLHRLPDPSKRSDFSRDRVCSYRIPVIIEIQLWPKRCVTSPFLASLDAKLRAIIDRRHSRKGIEQDMYREHMCLIVQLCVNPLHIMIVHKIVEAESVRPVAAHFVQPSYRVRNLKIIVLIVSGIERLVQTVIRNSVEHLRI